MLLCQHQSVPVSLQEGAFHWDCTAWGSRYGSQWQAGHIHSPDRPWLVSGIWHSQPQHTTRTAAVWVQRYRNTTGLAPVVTQRPDSVCQAGSASVTSCETWGRRSPWVCARASVVCHLVQPGRYHQRPWYSLSPIRWWHAAPCHECRQHSCKTITAVCTANCCKGCQSGSGSHTRWQFCPSPTRVSMSNLTAVSQTV